MIETSPSTRHLVAVQHALSALEQRHAEVTGSIPVLAVDFDDEGFGS